MICLRAVSALSVSTAQLFTGGPIYAMVDAPWVDGAGKQPVKALAVQDGLITYVGDDLEAARASLAEVVTVDLDGQALLPAFIDAHSHIGMVAENLDNVNLWPPKMGGNVTSIKQMVEILRNTEPLNGWVQGFGYDQSLLDEQRHPTRWDLDEAHPDVPVYVSHVAAHSGVANSKALELAGLNRHSKAPSGCELKRDSSGELTGMLEETLCVMTFMAPIFPKFDMSMRIRQLEQATKFYLSRGYTTAQNGFSSSDQNRCLEAAAAAGRLHCRIVSLPGGREHLPYVVAGATKDQVLNASIDPSRLSLGAVKWVGDGSISIRTAFVRNAYDLQVPDFPEGYCAYPHFSSKEITDGLRVYHNAGYKIAVHTNGDAAIDQVLTALETIAAEEGPFLESPVFIHSEFTHEDQLDRMVALGASPSFFNLHVFYWWQQWSTWASAKPEEITPMRSAIKRHMVYSSHTDSPVVDLEPLRIVWAAVTRKRGHDDGSAGEVFGASERIDTYAAFWGLTKGAAQQWDVSDRGSLVAGNRADFVILDRDPFALADPDHLLNISVVSTIIDGKAGFRTPQQPLANLSGLDDVKPIVSAVPQTGLFSETWILEAHGREEPSLEALDEFKQGACQKKSPHALSFPAWVRLFAGAVVLLGVLCMAFSARWLCRRRKHAAIPATDEAQISLQAHDEA